MGAALSFATVTLEDVVQIRKRLADTIVLWDTGACSANHGLGKNLLPSYDASNEHATLANTVKNVSGAKFQGSSAELATLDKLLAEHTKIGEIVRQMCAVRMSYQAESADNALACIVRARSVAIDDVSEASAKQRADALAEAQADMTFINNQVMALSALFKALHLALPSVLASRVMPDTSTKGMERETTTLVSVGEIQKLKQQTELRSERATASSSATTPKRSKSLAKEKWSAKKPGTPGSGKKKKSTRPYTPVSIRPHATPTSTGAEESVGKSRQQKKNERQRRNKRNRGGDDFDGGSGGSDDGAADRGARPDGGGSGGVADKRGSGKPAKAPTGGKQHRGDKQKKRQN